MLRPLLAPRWDDFSPEFMALLALLRQAQVGQGISLPGVVAQANSAALAKLMLQHGVAPWLLHRLGVHGLGLDTAEAELIKAQVRRNHARAMAAFALQVKLVKALQGAGIPSLPIKGVSSALRLYGDLGLRQVGDLDLMVSVARLDEACEVLKGLGLEMTFPKRPLNTAERAWVLRRRHHFNFEDPFTGFMVELHWAFHDGILLDDDDRLWAQTANETVSWAGHALPALDPVTDYLMLFTHHVRAGYRRLLSLLDIHLAWQQLGPTGQAALQQRLNHYGLQRTHQRLHDTIQWVCGAGTLPAAPPLELALATRHFNEAGRYSMLLDQFNFVRARRSWAYKLDALQQHALTWTDIEHLQLPARWFPLYGPLRLPLLVWRLLVGRPAR